ncbi:MAG: DUF5011 domain-containing protein, partial [Flavobacteriaceae bacterium]|nr:DUF5011 domain-containing protein [Flavobacteriaceae bacterium]
MKILIFSFFTFISLLPNFVFGNDVAINEYSNSKVTNFNPEIRVVATTAPVITLTGSSTITIQAGSIYTDSGATAFDAEDGDISHSIVVSNAVDTSTLGTYTVTYNVQDSDGNAAAPVTRTVHVVDTTKPVITLFGDPTVTLEVFTPYVDAGVQATDSFEGDLRTSLIIVDPVDTTVVGTYVITYNVSDASGNAANQKVRNVSIVDTTAPIITINGNPVINLAVGTPYTDLGASALDNFDGNITARINTINPVDNNTVGVYTVRYSVSDDAGNIATEVTRTINVVDTTRPIITLIGDANVSIEAGTSYGDAGAIAEDAEDGNISPNIVVANPVDVNSLGDYTITYNVQDSSGNVATQVTRTVTVVDTSKPVITLIGNSTVTQEVFTPYVDAGAEATDSYEGNITGDIVTVNPVNTTAVGTYVITYNVNDASGNTANQKVRNVTIVDTTAPIITINGNAVINLAVGATYTDLGASALDNYDGNITPSIFTINPVDSNTVGVYTVRYSVSDDAGNIATEVTRTINVVDTTRPVITLIGDATVSVEAGTSYVDAGAIAEDAVDGDISSNIVVSDPVDVNSLGDYTITYNVQDSSGNVATQVTRTVHVVDTSKPVITLLGNSTIEHEVFTPYVDAGAEATDSYEGNITGDIVTGNPVNTTNLGTYVITYNVSDASGNAASQVERTLKIVDTTAPEITINGNPVITLAVGTPYTDLGASALDNYDGNITASINTINPVDSNTVGVYTVRYSVSDAAGNIATEVIRTVNIVDAFRPIITLIGDANITLEVGALYVDAGATALDAEDGDISHSIVVSNPVDVNSLGSYTITYDVQDSDGNMALQASRTVTIVDITKPVITLLGNTTITQEVFTPYVDAGAEATDSHEGNITGNIVTVNPV